MTEIKQQCGSSNNPEHLTKNVSRESYVKISDENVNFILLGVN